MYKERKLQVMLIYIYMEIGEIKVIEYMEKLVIIFDYIDLSMKQFF